MIRKWLRGWLRENWIDIRYAHKSAWVSLVFIALVSARLGWDYSQYQFSDQLDQKDAIIEQLQAQNAALKALLPAKKPPVARKPGDANNGGNDDDVKEEVQDKIYELQNDLNNMKSNANIHYRDYKNKVSR